MTNEEIVVTFLKHHKKFAAFKRYMALHTTRYIEICDIKDTFKDRNFWHYTKESLRYWSTLDVKFIAMVEDLNLHGTVSLSKLLKYK